MWGPQILPRNEQFVNEVHGLSILAFLTLADTDGN